MPNAIPKKIPRSNERVFMVPKIQISKINCKIVKLNLSYQVWSHGGFTFKKKRTLNRHFPRLAETDPMHYWLRRSIGF